MNQKSHTGTSWNYLGIKLPVFVQAVTALTEGTRQELRALNSKIRIGQISPGFVDTEFFQAMNSQDAAFKNKMDKICEIALQSEDIYAAVKMMVTADPRCQVGDVQIRPTFQLS